MAADDPPQMRLARPYLLTGGRTRSHGGDLPLETLVISTGEGEIGGLDPDERSLLEYAMDPTSIAEIANACPPRPCFVIA